MRFEVETIKDTNLDCLQQGNSNNPKPNNGAGDKNRSRKFSNQAKAFRAVLAVGLIIAIVITMIFAFKKQKKDQLTQSEKETKNTLFKNELIAVKDQRWGIMNAKGKWVVEPTLENVDAAFTKNGAVIFCPEKNQEQRMGVILKDETVLYWVKENGLWGVKNATGEYITEPQFKSKEFSTDVSTRIEEHENLFEDYVIVQSIAGKYGYADLEGNLTIEPVFDKVRPFILENDRAYVSINEKMGVINRQGNFVLEPKYNYVSMTYDGSYIYKEDEKFGLLDESGNVQIQARFKELGGFTSNNLAMASDQNNNIGFINKSGEFVVEPQFIYAKPFDDNGVAIVYSNKKSCHLINAKGQILCTAQTIKPLKDGYYKIELKDKFGLIDFTGKIILPIKYDEVNYFEELKMFFAKVQESTEGGYFNASGNLIIPQKYKNLNLQKNGLIRFANEQGLYGFMNRSGKVVIEPEYTNAGDFADNGLALVEYNCAEIAKAAETRIAYIDKNGNRVIDPGNLVFGKRFTENNRTWVCTTDNLWGQIDATGKYVIKPSFSLLGYYFENENKYNNIYDFMENRETGSHVGFVDENGIMIKPKFKYPTFKVFQRLKYYVNLFVFYDDEYAVVYNGYSFGVINKSGEYIIAPKYSAFKRLIDK